jgi:hypothetical protein
MRIQIGAVVSTLLYNRGPYVIKSISDTCNCPRYTDELGYTNSGMENESPDHYHFVCHSSEDINDLYYLNGYQKKGTQILNVWYDDEIIIHQINLGTQLTLF